MPLNGDVLGAAINDIENDYNETQILPADIPAARLQLNKRIAWAIINHFKDNGVLHVPGAGLAAPNGAVTGEATGTIE